MNVTYGWACLECDEAGTGPRSDKDAEKHTKTTKHPTRSWAKPQE